MIAQAPNNSCLWKAWSHHPSDHNVCMPEAFWRSPPENKWNEKSSAHLGFPESGCLLAQFCARPFQFVQAGFHTVHPAGELPDVILVTCPLRESPFQLTERHVEGQQSVPRSWGGVCPGHPTRRKCTGQSGKGRLGLAYQSWVPGLQFQEAKDIWVQVPRQKVGLDIKPGASTPVTGDAGISFRAQLGEIPPVSETFYGAKQDSRQGENQYLTPSMWAGHSGEKEKELIKEGRTEQEQAW